MLDQPALVQDAVLVPEARDPVPPVPPHDLNALSSAKTLEPVPMVTPHDLDRILHVLQSRFTAGRSPSTEPLAFLDWTAHAADAPFQMSALGVDAFRQWLRLAAATVSRKPVIEPASGDRRFAGAAWHDRPFDLVTQAVLLGEEWVENVVQTPGGVDKHNRDIVAFTVRQWLDFVSPSNIPWLNPEVIETTWSTGGRNLVTGLGNAVRELAGGSTKRGFTVGADLAATPGKVVFRNELIELIQYAPTTPTVGAEPVLIVPAWIMKYYILDLSPKNSLIRWLVSEGHTVFAISWRNPGAEMRDTPFDAYREKGVMAAIDAIDTICGHAKIHATGYCLGGTLLTIAAAAMARDGDHRLASMTLFAAQTDFTEAGELQLFITEDQLDFLNDVMHAQGYLDSAQMAGAFTMLRSNDLVWAHAIRDYLLGEQDEPNDLMFWNADGTRLPARMHIEYLRHMFLNNDLAEGRFQAGGRPVEIEDIKLPIFVVSTEHDHIAPWRSVFKLHLLNSSDLTFVLTSGGHNAGIVSEPGHPRRHFRIGTREASARTRGPDEWQRDTPVQDGSWWLAWNDWLNLHSGPRIAPPAMGGPSYAPLCDAPGTYVLEA
ncbi:MAG: alpha/beta fold hydrolase [Beijerinckiaceae bacterium]|nr:alpha/beta fold hydrolase [Beijerinckiaceae bacterium]